MKVRDIRLLFAGMLARGEFVTGRGDQQMLEVLGVSFIADEASVFGKVNEEYVDREIAWYESESTNVNDIGPDVPAAWKATANEHGEVNSNYGHLIFSEKYHSQFRRVIEELGENPESRRAIMVYTRPSIWVEYDENGKNDFICTNAVQYLVRNDRVHAVVQMRSNDLVYGYKNDRYWQRYVLETVAFKLGLHVGEIHWQVGSLHVYPRHFRLVQQYRESDQYAQDLTLA
jgi:thymidylate synthase